jgi:uncharacterized protein with FMN-binding domain
MRKLLLIVLLLAGVAFGEDVPKRTKAEIDKLIDTAGKTPPDWWDKTPLNYPKTLDLTFTNNPGGWQPQKNVGAYVWDHIDPNPGRWPEGIKLMNHIMTINKNNPDAQKKAMGTTAKIYTEMMGDYARGAYWAKKHGGQPIMLAECYFKLGCMPAAQEILRALGADSTRNSQVIKLWSDMGDLKTALAIAERKAAGGDPTSAYLAAGDSCRRAGKTAEAIKYYEKALAAKTTERDEKVNRKRAQASLEAIKLFDGLDLNKIADGTYKASSIAYVGPLEVSVTVKDHKIEKVEVTNHKEKQFYGSIAQVPPQIVAKQSVKGIDATTGATVTSEAIINASAKALAGAQKN